MRWLLLDEVIEIQKGVSAKTRGHVPDAEYSAEILMLEMMAQTGGMLLGAQDDFQSDVIFAKVESAEFALPLQPNESVTLVASSDNLRPEGAWIDAKVLGESRELARSRFLLMSLGHLVPGRNSSITFHEVFMNHFKIREKIK